MSFRARVHTKTKELLQEIQMGKRPRIFENERNGAIGLITAGCHQQKVVRQFNVYPSTISQLLSRFRVTWLASTSQRHSLT
jgi:hypothetical protein